MKDLRLESKFGHSQNTKLLATAKRNNLKMIFELNVNAND